MSQLDVTVPESEKKHEIRVHIEEHERFSPNPTTGHDLYDLGKVPHGELLYREVTGDREDELVPDDSTPIHLQQDEHFHYKPREWKEFTVIIDGRPKQTRKHHLDFDQVVRLAFGKVEKEPNIDYRITYTRGPKQNPQGILVEGQKVKIKEGMVFNVKRADKS